MRRIRCLLVAALSDAVSERSIRTRSSSLLMNPLDAELAPPKSRAAKRATRLKTKITG